MGLKFGELTRPDQRMWEVETHQESQAFSRANIRLLCLSSTHTANRAWQWAYTGTENIKTVVSPVTLQSRVTGFDSLYPVIETVRNCDHHRHFPSRGTLERACSIFVVRKTQWGVFKHVQLSNPLSVILMCHKAVFHVFPLFHSSQACCKWIPHVAQASEKKQSDLVSHPAAVQAADGDPGPALPALTLHFLQSWLMTLSLGSASASGLGCSSLSQETSTPFTALLKWPGRLNPPWPRSYPSWGMWCHEIINKSWFFFSLLRANLYLRL